MKIGKVTENVLKRSILRQIKTKRREVTCGAGLGADCAVFSSENANLDVVSCTLGGAEPASGLLIKCNNILASREASGVAVSLNILLAPDSEEPRLKEIMKDAESTCAELGMEIAQAQAYVTEAVKSPFVTVTAYGICGISPDGKEPVGGRVSPAGMGYGYHTVREAKPGQEIVLSKWIGLEGTAILAKRHRETILQRYPSWLVNEAEDFRKYLSTVPEAAVAIKSGARTLYNLSEGGIFAGLWELAEGAGVGLTIDLKKIPVRQETVEICNHLNVNPYELLSGGSLLMTAKDGEALVEALMAEQIPAAVIGRVTDSNDRLILNEDEVRYLDRPHVDGIYSLFRQLRNSVSE